LIKRKNWRCAEVGANQDLNVSLVGTPRCGVRTAQRAVPTKNRFAPLGNARLGQMLGLDYWQTESFLKERGVPLNYTAADSEADNAALAKILAHSSASLFPTLRHCTN